MCCVESKLFTLLHNPPRASPLALIPFTLIHVPCVFVIHISALFTFLPWCTLLASLRYASAALFVCSPSIDVFEICYRSFALGRPFPAQDGQVAIFFGGSPKPLRRQVSTAKFDVWPTGQVINNLYQRVPLGASSLAPLVSEACII